MAKFTKKPVEIEAIQFVNTSSYDEMFQAWGEDFASAATYEPTNYEINILTLEGTMTAHPIDWVIRGIQGEFYPIKNDIFLASYDAV